MVFKLDTFKRNQIKWKLLEVYYLVAKNWKKCKYRRKNLKQLKKLLCEDTEFWSNLALIEELLRPLKSAILSTEGSIVDVSKAYKVVGTALDKTSEIASKFPTEQVKPINEVTI